MTGLSGAFEDGLMAMELDSNVGFGVGAFGSAERVAEPSEDSAATVLEKAGEAIAAGLGRSEFGSHIRRRAAESNKDHLSFAGRGGAAVAYDTGSIPVPQYRCHWPIGHILRSTNGLGQDVDEGVTPPPPCFLKVIDIAGA